LWDRKYLNIGKVQQKEWILNLQVTFAGLDGLDVGINESGILIAACGM
jgi:hypothetical protein